MSLADKIEKVSSIKESLGTSGLDGMEDFSPPNRAHFDSLMNQESVKADTNMAVDADSIKMSPIEIQREASNKISFSKNPSHNDLIAQLDNTIKNIDNVKSQLTTTNDNQFKSSVETVMRKKLEHIDESLKSAMSHVGSEFDKVAATKDQPSNGILGPVQRFLGMLSQGQHELYNLSGNIHALAESKQLSPASLLAVQIKVNMVQQQVELFTALLNKTLESTKTIMNVQV